LARELSPLCGGRISSEDLDRLACARDMWPRWLIFAREGLWPRPPDLVVSPATVREVSAVLAACHRLRVPVVPYGAGSGVCGGALCSEGGVALDLKLLSRVRRIDAGARVVEVEAGHLGWTLEEKLARAGFTAGHFPSSISCSTVGGWLAARGAGQLSTRYGKIEDLCVGVEAVLADGERFEAHAGLGEGPWVDLLAGSEGTLAVVAAATLRLRPTPERQRFAAYQFPSVEAGLAALRDLLRAGLRPAVVRLYDPLDTLMASAGDGGEAKSVARSKHPEPGRVVALEKRLGFKALGVGLRASWLLNRTVDFVARKGCRLVLVFEGAAAICEVEARESDALLRKLDARPLGAAPAEHWWAHRYDISFRQAALFAAGLWVDTLELSARWDKLNALYRAVRRALSPYALCMAHFSHAYPEGCSVYVTFAGGGATAEEAAGRHRDAWSAALAAALAEGVSVSHHHGVGLAKAEAYQRQLGEGGSRLLTALKGALDPEGVLNPGKLGLAKPSVQLTSATATRALKARPSHPASTAELVAELEDRSRSGRARAFDGIDRSAMDQIGPVSEQSILVEVGAGRRLGGLESRLRSHGLTLGPLAPSVVAGTVASWIEGPHRGLRATPGGFLESGAFSIEAVLPDGSLFRTPAVPRSAAGPGLESLVTGGAGRCALLTSAVLRISPAPSGRRRVVLRAKTLGPLLEALRSAMDGDAVPTAAGLWRNQKDIVLAASFDTSEALSHAHADLVIGLAKRRSLARGTAKEANHWWSGRADSAGQEVAVSWGELPALFELWTGRLELYRITYEGALAVGARQSALLEGPKKSRWQTLFPLLKRPRADLLLGRVQSRLRADLGAGR
jgi:alkyldihydroxyacetonephosphate synthase